MSQGITEARIISQIERLAVRNDPPTNDIHAWLEAELSARPELFASLSETAQVWLKTYGLG